MNTALCGQPALFQAGGAQSSSPQCLWTASATQLWLLPYYYLLLLLLFVFLRIYFWFTEIPILFLTWLCPLFPLKIFFSYCYVFQVEEMC